MHRDLIIALGGAPAVAERHGLDRRVVANWMTRGVSWAFRATIAADARRRRIKLPEDFLKPPAPKPAPADPEPERIAG